MPSFSSANWTEVEAVGERRACLRVARLPTDSTFEKQKTILSCPMEASQFALH